MSGTHLSEIPITQYIGSRIPLPETMYALEREGDIMRRRNKKDRSSDDVNYNVEKRRNLYLTLNDISLFLRVNWCLTNNGL